MRRVGVLGASLLAIVIVGAGCLPPPPFDSGNQARVCNGGTLSGGPIGGPVAPQRGSSAVVWVPQDATLIVEGDVDVGRRDGTVSNSVLYWDAIFDVNFRDANETELTGSKQNALVGAGVNDAAPIPPRSHVRMATANDGPSRYIQVQPWMETGYVVKYQLHVTVQATGPLPSCDPGAAQVPGPPADYFVVLKAWIPHQEVPEVTVPDAPPPTCPGSGNTDRLTFLGDAHAGSGAGSYRAVSVLRFHWDGSQIVSPTGQVLVSPTTLRYYKGDPSTGYTVRCEVQGLGDAGGNNAAEATGPTSFELTIDAHNSLSLLAPAISSKLKGDLVEGGRVMRLAWSTDQFPSHAIDVYRDDALLFEKILFDASCINVWSVSGVLAVANGLFFQNNTGASNLVTEGVPVLENQPTCASPPARDW